MVYARVGGNVKQFLFSVVLLFLAGCGGGYRAPKLETVEPPKVGGTVKHPLEEEGIQPALVARYHSIGQWYSEDENKIYRYVNYRDIKYLPRQSEFEGFEGWDMLTSPWPGDYPGDDWLNLTLNRNAVIVIVMNEWQYNNATDNDRLGVFSAWQAGTTTAENEKKEETNYFTFTKAFGQGAIKLPPVKDTNYIVLLAEEGGTPSATPALPTGETVQPQPNEKCPEWLSAKIWLASGPDGLLYKSWHPQIDPIYWCYYEHEHGSDPSVVGYNHAAFEYTAFKNDNQPELHEGFKGFAIQDKEKDLGYYINIHSETGVVSRACARHHTVVFAVTKLSTGELLAELSYKGDFGAVRNNQTGEVFQPAQDKCPNQAQIAAQNEPASRRIRVFEGGNDPGGYEQWDGGLPRTLGFDYPEWSAGMGIDIRNPATGCNTSSCTGALKTTSHADQRTIEFHEVTLKYNGFLDGADGDGVFYTDVYGTRPLQATEAGAVKQYVQPGLAIELDGFFTTQDPWRSLYLETHDVPGVELENSLGTVN
jgi:hypothetical protein